MCYMLLRTIYVLFYVSTEQFGVSYCFNNQSRYFVTKSFNLLCYVTMFHCCTTIIDKYNDINIKDCFVFAHKIPVKVYN